MLILAGVCLLLRLHVYVCVHVHVCVCVCVFVCVCVLCELACSARGILLRAAGTSCV